MWGRRLKNLSSNTEIGFRGEKPKVESLKLEAERLQQKIDEVNKYQSSSVCFTSNDVIENNDQLRVGEQYNITTRKMKLLIKR